jgi:oxygen-independent coproporphyrinogen-3 oxidase
MRPETVERFSAPVPRYTSYPTAARFNGAVGGLQFATALAALDGRSPASLYVHVPFCSELCWYCGCSTKATRQRAPVADYARHLLAEIMEVAEACQDRISVSHIHWGGGSPNSLSATQIVELSAALRANFSVAANAEFAVEIDPRSMAPEQVDAFAAAGVNRVSIGVQDFDPVVQAAINRHQPYEMTRDVVGQLRAGGIANINIDLVYGLPHQTRESVQRTIGQVLELAPSRIALFGYAHMPSRFAHQRLIDDAALPDARERYAQSRRARRLLEEAGYRAVGLDHFALASDELVTGDVRRNFQGYTTDTAESLIGLGASAISRLPQGYFQNAVDRQDYQRRIETDGLATVRGVLLNDDDRVRAHVIERLMCEFEFSAEEVSRRFGETRGAEMAMIAADIVEADTDGLVEVTPDGFRVSELGQPFVRSIASCFDAYLESGQGRFSAGV